MTEKFQSPVTYGNKGLPSSGGQPDVRGEKFQMMSKEEHQKGEASGHANG